MQCEVAYNLRQFITVMISQNTPILIMTKKYKDPINIDIQR